MNAENLSRLAGPRRDAQGRLARASVLSLLRPDARAAIAVENEPGIVRSGAGGGPGAVRSIARPRAGSRARAP